MLLALLPPDRTARIAHLNDVFRQTMGIGGKVHISKCISSMSAEDQSTIRECVKKFESFNVDNDPRDEHDFGSFTFKDQKIIWRIDYYDRAMRRLSDDPSDPRHTLRVMTIMKAGEY